MEVVKIEARSGWIMTQFVEYVLAFAIDKLPCM